jgi:hypothetical protein
VTLTDVVISNLLQMANTVNNLHHTIINCLDPFLIKALQTTQGDNLVVLAYLNCLEQCGCKRVFGDIEEFCVDYEQMTFLVSFICCKGFCSGHCINWLVSNLHNPTECEIPAFPSTRADLTCALCSTQIQ